MTPGYKAPAQVDLKTIQELDADDESLVKYKQQLLGATGNVLGAVTVISSAIVVVQNPLFSIRTCTCRSVWTPPHERV